MIRSTIARRRRACAALAFASIALGVAACDTGDGTELREPTTSTTLPSPTTTSASTMTTPSTVLDSFGVDSLPTQSLPAPSQPAPADAGAELSDTAGLSVVAPWPDGAAIEIAHTCDGGNVAPALTWSGVPDGTVELAVAMVDESDLGDGRPAIGWTMAGIDPAAGSLGEDEVPDGAQLALNVFGDVDYTGPCPALGEVHSYTLTLFALDEDLELSDGTPAGQMLDLISTLATDAASVSGTFTR